MWVPGVALRGFRCLEIVERVMDLAQEKYAGAAMSMPLQAQCEARKVS